MAAPPQGQESLAGRPAKLPLGLRDLSAPRPNAALLPFLRASEEQLGSMQLQSYGTLQDALQRLRAGARLQQEHVSHNLGLLAAWEAETSGKPATDAKTAKASEKANTKGKNHSGKVAQQSVAKKMGSAQPEASESLPPKDENADTEIKKPEMLDPCTHSFWEDVDAHFQEAMTSDLDWLKQLSTEVSLSTEMRQIPSLGRSYTDVWAERDFKTAPDAIATVSASSASDATQNTGLVRRLLASMVDVEPKRRRPTYKMVGGSGSGSSGSSSGNGSGRTDNKAARPDAGELLELPSDVSLKRQLTVLGLSDWGSDDEEDQVVEAAAKEDDPVVTELRVAQEQLQEQLFECSGRFQSLHQRVQEMLGRPDGDAEEARLMLQERELTTKLDSVSEQIEDVYWKRVNLLRRQQEMPAALGETIKQLLQTRAETELKLRKLVKARARPY
eukprot:m.37364 g.37364  ORF g.37364 m.37364 type:complete len:444 (-) comp11536_c0_seq1:363-1694(-)